MTSGQAARTVLARPAAVLDDPRVGQEGHADGDDEGDWPGSCREQDSKGNDHAEAEADRDESHGIESGDGRATSSERRSTAPRASVSVAGRTTGTGP